MVCTCCLPAKPVVVRRPEAPHKPAVDSAPTPSTDEKRRYQRIATDEVAPERSRTAGARKVTINRVFAMDPAAVIATMQNPDYQKDADLMCAACKQLRVLCREDEHCMMCDTLGAAGEVARTMTTYRALPDLQQQACAALINLCSARRVEPRNHAAEQGALNAIVAAMTVHIDYPQIQEMAVIAIQNIIIGQDANDKMRKDRAVEAGALEAIVEAARRYEEMPSVLDQGTATLRLLCSKDKDLRRRAEELGAKKDWLGPQEKVRRESGGLSSRMGLTSRMLRGRMSQG